MELRADTIGNTPILVLPTTAKEPWSRVYGATDAAIPGSWVFPAYYPLGFWAVRDLDVLSRGTGLTLGDSARLAIKRLREADADYRRALAQYEKKLGVDLPLPVGWRWHKNEPFAHQRLGIAIGLTWWRHLYLWEMGTGKTKTIVESLRLRRAAGQFGKALVVCPRIVVSVWQREVAAHTDGELTTYHWQASDDGKVERAATADVVVVTYQTARIEAQNALEARKRLRAEAKSLTDAERERLAAASVDPLAASGFGDIYADESHMLAEYTSQQTRAVLALSAGASRRGALSGTAADQPMKLYPQLRFLAPGLMPVEYQQFLNQHVVFDPVRRYLVKYYKGLNGLNERVNTIASRMKKADCLDLPPQVFVDVPFSLGLHQKHRYNEIVRTMSVTTKPLVNLARAEDDTALSEEDLEVLMEMPHGAARVGKILQVSSGFIIKGNDPTVCDTCPNMPRCVEQRIKPYTRLCVVQPTPLPREIIRDFENPKVFVFEDLVERILDADDANKVICWANLTPELDDMQAVCARRKWGHVRIDGDTTKDIDKLEPRFQGDPACRVAIGIVSAGVGITLTAANYTVYYALPWNRVHYRQSLERNNRPGQTRKMTVYRLIGNHTIEPAVAAVLAKKDLIAATLTEKIDCASCVHVERCRTGGIKPFGDGCIYQPEVRRPVVTVNEVD